MAKIHKSATIQVAAAHCPVVLDANNVHAGSRPSHTISSRTAHILNEANEQAERLLDAARNQAREIRETAWREGHQAGVETARQEQSILARQMRLSFDQQIELINQQYNESIEAMQPDLLELSLNIAEKILGLEMSRNDAAFLGLVSDALNRFKQGEKVSIQVSKNDYWRSMISSAYAAAGQAETYNLLVDENMADGSCLIESSGSIVDAGVVVQLQKIREAMIEISQEVSA